MKIQQFHKSLAVYLPKQIAEALGWEVGDEVNVKLADKGTAMLIRKGGE